MAWPAIIAAGASLLSSQQQGDKGGGGGGMVASPVAGALTGLAAGLLGPGRAEEKKMKEYREYLNYLKATSLEVPKAEQARLQAGFETKLGTLGMLGMPGTYDMAPGADYSTLLGSTAPKGSVTVSYIDPTDRGRKAAKLLGKAPGDPLTAEDIAKLEAKGVKYSRAITSQEEDPESFMDTVSKLAQKDPVAAQQLYRQKYGKEYFEEFRKPREGVLDPEKFAKMVSKMPASQIISRQLAEARDLTNPQSAFRQTLENSIFNPIIEQGAEAMRESMRYIRNETAKGGTARRTALAEAQTMLSIERNNRAVAQEMWTASLNFENWIRGYQRESVNAAFDFVNNLGIDQYVNSMNSAGRFMVETTVPTTADLANEAFNVSMQYKKKNLGKLVLGGALLGTASMLSLGKGITKEQVTGGPGQTAPTRPTEFGGFGPVRNMPPYGQTTTGPLYTPETQGQGPLTSAPPYGGGFIGGLYK